MRRTLLCLLCSAPSHMAASCGAQADLARHGISPASACMREGACVCGDMPQFGECVVSVARKTDAALWPPLFAAVGEASALAEGLLAAGALHRAACALLIVDRLQGSHTAHQLALRLMQVAPPLQLALLCI